MPADPHPFLHPDPAVAQAARDKAKPMAPREGECVMRRDGSKSELASSFLPAWQSHGGRDRTDGADSPHDIIAAVDPVTGAVIRTADGVVEGDRTAALIGAMRVLAENQIATPPLRVTDLDTAPPASTGAVKALVWKEREDGGQWYGDGPCDGHYTVLPEVIGEIEGPWVCFLDGLWRPFPSLDAAKSAAQADYTARILSALPDGARVVTGEQYEAAIASVRAQALEEAAGVIVHFEHIGDIALPQRWQDAIRALSPTPDTTTPVIEAAKAVVAADDELCKHLGITAKDKYGGDLMDALRAALAAHEARHG